MFNNKNIHMIGIGGISMSSIAMILKSFDCNITGYDLNKSDNTDKLLKNGIEVNFDFNYKNIDKADIIVYTAAIKDDNPELVYARKLNKEVYERSTFLGLLMREYKNVICISGTHGKSTTTGMISSIFLNKLNPTISIGANLPIINGNYHVGSKDFFIAEACEYVDSFLDFFPTCEIILNIDNDHLDYFKNIDNIINSFKRFTTLLPENGFLIINADDEKTLFACRDVKKKITFGIENSANYMAKNITYNEKGYPTYDLYINNSFVDKIILNVLGKHNILNSLASIAAAYCYNISFEDIKNGLYNYKGVQRRFEYVGQINGASIYDDYAHHPSEILATLNSCQKTKHNKNYIIFQSHTYSRTKDHLNDFAKILSKFDNIIIAKIYAARENNDVNIHEEDLVNLIKQYGNQNVIYLDTFDKIENYIKENVNENDLILTVGAGDIYKVAYNLKDSTLK